MLASGIDKTLVVLHALLRENHSLFVLLMQICNGRVITVGKKKLYVVFHIMFLNAKTIRLKI